MKRSSSPASEVSFSTSQRISSADGAGAGGGAGGGAVCAAVVPGAEEGIGSILPAVFWLGALIEIAAGEGAALAIGGASPLLREDAAPNHHAPPPPPTTIASATPAAISIKLPRAGRA